VLDEADDGGTAVNPLRQAAEQARDALNAYLLGDLDPWTAGDVRNALDEALAQRLANVLDNYIDPPSIASAAAELRRLHARVEELETAAADFNSELSIATLAQETQRKRIAELEGVMVRARNVLDAGVKISPESVIHDDLRAALSKALEGK
jgi:hypothetical protein